jgi:translation initiation factor 3 subunit H
MADTLKDMPFKAVQVDALVCALSAIPPLRSPTTALCALFIAILGTAAADDDDGV